MATTNKTTLANPVDSSLGIQELLTLSLGHWYWFVLSLLVTLGVAALYILRTPPVYTRQASLLIKENAKGRSVSNEVGEAFSDMGLFQSSTNVNNELIALRSPAVMLDVVKRLHLDVNYAVDGTFYRRTLYGTDLPFTVRFEEIADNENVSFVVTPAAQGEGYQLR